jgi:bifunctional DNA primase/polymerase-like protein/AAA domain-containing protein/primase-like protein
MVDRTNGSPAGASRGASGDADSKGVGPTSSTENTDAQAPGKRSAVRDLSEVIRVSETWPVFPCREKAEPGHKEKSPYTEGGFKSASQERPQITTWWRKHPRAMIGVPTGAESKFWVLDLDVKDGNRSALDWWEQLRDGREVNTRVHRTPRGGYHYLFRWDPDRPVRSTQDELHLSVDTRGRGGYVVVPPSVTASGGAYVVERDVEVSDAPDWLYEIAPLAREEEGPKTREERREKPDVARIRAALSAINVGYDGWWRIASAIRRELNNQTGLEMFLEWSRNSSGFVSDADCRKKWSDVSNVSMITPGTIFHIATAQDPDWELRYEHPRWFEVLFQDGWWCEDDDEIPRRQFVLNKHYIRNYVTASVGAGGSAKTTHCMTEAISMTVGRDVTTGVKMPEGPQTVWYVNAEETQDELDARAAAICKRYEVTKQELGGRLLLHSVRKDPLRVAYLNAKGIAEVNEETVAFIKRFLKQRKVSVFIFDPLVSFHSVRENMNEDMDVVIKVALGGAAESANAAGHVVHHTGKPKPGQTELTADSSRGASAIIYAARDTRVFNFMSKEAAAKKYGIPEDERRRYIAYYSDMARMGPSGGKPTWLRIVLVLLANGDEVAVVERWKPADTFEGITTEDMRKAVELAGSGKYRANVQAKEWFGYALAPLLNMSVYYRDKERTDARELDKLKSIIKTWIDNKVLKEVDGETPHREPCKYIVPGDYEPPQGDFEDFEEF